MDTMENKLRIQRDAARADCDAAIEELKQLREWCGLVTAQRNKARAELALLREPLPNQAA